MVQLNDSLQTESSCNMLDVSKLGITDTLQFSCNVETNMANMERSIMSPPQKSPCKEPLDNISLLFCLFTTLTKI